MIRQLFKIPTGCYVACSGGSDSMAILDFLNAGNKVRGALYFDHKTDQSKDFGEVVRQYCTKNNLEYLSKALDKEKDEKSLESFWSKERNKFFKMINAPVITGHNLDDAVEWWVYTALKGNPCIMPASNKNILRPFLSTRKRALKDWVNRKNISYIEDKTNKDVGFMRNFIRHQMIADCQVVNPGLHKTIFKKLREREKMKLRIGDDVRHMSNPNVWGKIIDIQMRKAKKMSTGGSIEGRKFALVATPSGDQHWVPYDDIMQSA